MGGQQRPLQGIRVVDLSQYIPGPFATQVLADLGAEVLKVEPPGGDPMRHFMNASGREISPIYQQLNAGKQVVRVDLKSDQGRDALSGWLAKADVLLESFRPGVLARLGFDHDRLQALNPRLIHCALSGFGQNGPKRNHPGHDVNYLALTGALHVTGGPDQPAIPYPPIADHAGGQQAVIAILAALVQRAQSGQGAHLDVSLFEAVLSWQYAPLTQAATGHPEKRGGGLLNGGAAYYNIYRTADDRFVALGALEPKFWQNFCSAVDRADWVFRQADPMPQRRLMAELRDLFVGRTQEDWIRVLEEADCCFQAILEPGEVERDEQVRARQTLGRMGGLGALFPAWIDGQPPQPREAMRELDLQTGIGIWA